MRITGITSAAFLSLLLGIAATAYTQDKGEKGDKGEKEARPAQQQSRQETKPAEQAQPQQHAQQHSQPAQQPQQRVQQQPRSDQNKQQEHAQQQRQDQNNRQQQAQQQRGSEQRSPERQRVEQSSWQEHRSRNWDSDHRNWQQRGGYTGYRVPDDRYRGYFGYDHGFRVGGLPFLVVGGFPRFQYNGYWISTVDPWPEYWGSNWYDHDDVYVVYVDNGYYMYNRRYPGSGVAISISL